MLSSVHGRFLPFKSVPCFSPCLYTLQFHSTHLVLTAGPLKQGSGPDVCDFVWNLLVFPFGDIKTLD